MHILIFVKILCCLSGIVCWCFVKFWCRLYLISGFQYRNFEIQSRFSIIATRRAFGRRRSRRLLIFNSYSFVYTLWQCRFSYFSIYKLNVNLHTFVLQYFFNKIYRQTTVNYASLEDIVNCFHRFQNISIMAISWAIKKLVQWKFSY